jgi:hypothetical protein
MEIISELCCGECGKTLGDEPIFAKTSRGPRYCKPCWQIVDADEIAAEAACDRWHDGYFAKTRPTDPDELGGWLQAREDAKVRVVMPTRPEGYYHMPLGSFD